jgi:hypothetical protein
MVADEVAQARGGWTQTDWCAAVGISKPMFYVLDPAPRVARIGRRVIVVESPRDYLERLSAHQAQRKPHRNERAKEVT